MARTGMAVCISLALWSFAAARVQEKDPTPRLPVPPAADRKRDENQIRDLFKSTYAKRSPEVRLELARNLLKNANEEEISPSMRFVLLSEARDLAAEAGDVSIAFTAIDTLDVAFEIDPIPMKTAALDSARKRARSPDQFRALTEGYLKAAEGELKADRYAAARGAASSAASCARRTGDPSLVEQANDFSKNARTAESAYRRVKKAIETLEAKPADPDAGEKVGRFYCFIKGDWEKGLSPLSNSADEALRKAAEVDLAAPQEAGAQADAGHLWYELAQKERDKTSKAAELERAGFWFHRALAGLSGLPKLRAEKRLGEVEKLLGGRSRAGQINLLRGFDVSKNAVRGDWSFTGGALHVKVAGRGFSQVRFPVVPKGGYELGIEFTRNSGQWSFGPTLPVGDRTVALALSWDRGGGERFSGLHSIDGKQAWSNATTRPGELENGRRYRLLVRVRLLPAEQARIEVSLDGKPYLEWKGALKSLSPGNNFTFKGPASLGWSSYTTDMVFHRVSLRMLSGRAERVSEK